MVSDTEFNNADWALNITSNVGGTVTAGQVNSGGNPGNYRNVTNTGITDPATIFLAAVHLNPSFVYDPATQGAIDSIDWSIDFQNLSSGQAVQLALEQGGVVAVADTFVTTSAPAGWNTHPHTGLTAADFPTLDFSATGAPITLGFRTANSGQIGIFQVGYDNFEVTITSVVPEPATAVLLTSGLIGLLGVGRRRKA